MEHSEAPLVYHVWTGLWTIAAALRRRVWIDQIRYKYFTNQYIILVGPAAITKSTAIDAGKHLLRNIPGVHFGPASATWQSFIKNLSESAQEMAPTATAPGSTFCGMSLAVSELGTFFKVEDATMMDVLTSLWDCPPGEWTHSTLSMGNNTVENPWINMIGGTTPSWIKKHFPEDLIGGGLTSRIVFIYGERKSHLVAYPARQIHPEPYFRNEQCLVDDLVKMSKLRGEYVLTDAAYQWGEDWYEEHHTNRPKHMASERYASYIGRKQSHMHKISMLLAASKRDEMMITIEDLQEALALLDAVEPHMQKVFEQIGMVDEARRTGEILTYVRTYGVMTSDELWSRVQNIMTSKDFNLALTSAVRSQQLQVVMKGPHRAVAIHPNFKGTLQ